MYKKTKNFDTNSMKVFSFFYDLVLILIGCLFAGFGVANFLLPHQLSSGGFAGIATVLYYLFDFQMGNMIIIMNTPLFIIGYFKSGKEFVIKTIIATFLYSKFIDIFGSNLAVDDKLLSSIYGGIFVGIGLALVFKANSSTGGTDLIAHIAQSYNINMTISNSLVIMDVVIVFFNVIFFGELQIGLYSAIAIYIIGKMIDIVFEGINYCKIIYIISDRYNDIMNIINTQINRGATGLYGKGSFTQKNKMIIMCVSKRRDLEIIKKTTKKIDSNAFIIISDAREVYGLGFKS